MPTLAFKKNIISLGYLLCATLTLGIQMSSTSHFYLGIIFFLYSALILLFLFFTFIIPKRIKQQFRLMTLGYFLILITQTILIVESYLLTSQSEFLLASGIFTLSSYAQLSKLTRTSRFIFIIVFSVYEIIRLRSHPYFISIIIFSNLQWVLFTECQNTQKLGQEQKFDKILAKLIEQNENSEIQCLLKNEKEFIYLSKDEVIDSYKNYKTGINEQHQVQIEKDQQNQSFKFSGRALNKMHLPELNSCQEVKYSEQRNKLSGYTFSYNKNIYQCFYSSRKDIDSPRKNQITQLKKNIQNQIYKVSHDMRTPLNAIINMLKCLQDLIDPNLDERYLRPSLSSCELLMNLLRDILDQAQLENQQIRIVYRFFKIQNFLSKVIEVFRIQAQKKNIKLEIQIDRKIPKRIKSDKFRLRQILINLISNSLKYTEGQGNIIISVKRKSDQVYEMKISDDGIGIKKEDMDRLFQSFYKVTDEKNMEKNPQGVGLGLQISQELAILMGPKDSVNRGIKVESEYGKGTTFSFEIYNHIDDELENLISEQSEELLQQKQERCQTQMIRTVQEVQMSSQKPIPHPMISVQNEANWVEQKNYTASLNPRQMFYQLSSLSHKSMDLQSLQKKRQSSCDLQIQIFTSQWNENFSNLAPILIVDDNEFNIVALQFQLEKLLLAAESAISGQEAIKKIQERNINRRSQFQIVFMDIEMPGMSGEQTATRLLEIDPNLNIVPCSGYEQEELVAKWKTLGMKQAINKPIEKLKLKECLLRYLMFK